MAKVKADEVKATEEKVGFEVLGVYVKGKLMRSYPVSIHGTRTKEYAEQYAVKMHGEVKKVR